MQLFICFIFGTMRHINNLIYVSKRNYVPPFVSQSVLYGIYGLQAVAGFLLDESLKNWNELRHNFNNIGQLFVFLYWVVRVSLTIIAYNFKDMIVKVISTALIKNHIIISKNISKILHSDHEEGRIR